MADYLIYDGNMIVDCIIADSKEIAEEATGMEAYEKIGEEWMGWVKDPDTGEWKNPAPHPTWYFYNNEWLPPFPKPEDEYEYVWNEERNNWQKVGDEFEELINNSENDSNIVPPEEEINNI